MHTLDFGIYCPTASIADDIEIESKYSLLFIYAIHMLRYVGPIYIYSKQYFSFSPKDIIQFYGYMS